ncbi:MAG TPA: hypothetical protein VGE57_04965, partial [Solimonas sp.]
LAAWTCLLISVAGSTQAQPAPVPRPAPPTSAPALPPAAPAATAALPLASAAPAAPTAATAAPVATTPLSTPPTAAAPATPATPAAMTRDTHALLYRLDQCLRRLARDYNRVPQYRPSLQQLDLQIDEIESLLWQLRQRQMPTDRQITLFKTEMQIRRLRESVPNQ